MRFHVLGLCHTVSSKEWLSCAFTQKVVKFCTMMMPRNDEEKELKKKMSVDELIRHKTIHYVMHYGHERSQVDADETIAVIDDKVMIETYGEYNWKKEFFKHASGDLAHQTFMRNGIAEIYKRKKKGDFILCFWGAGHQPIADAFRHECTIVEPGIGYPVNSSLQDSWKVFESYAWMHTHYGERKVVMPPMYDCVIPNYFDPNDFDFKEEKSNYFLYLGRIQRNKGLDIVLQLAERLGFRLVIAGQGSLEHDMGQTNVPCNIEYVGYADVEKRRHLMANAKALFLTTYYVEPFGGVTMEAMMSGTPVITTDWGVFTETVLHGVTGYRCRTMDQFQWAVRNIDKINPKACRDWALANYSLTKVRIMFEEYFEMILNVKFGAGFYAENAKRNELSWLQRDYPVEACSAVAHIPRSVQRKPRIAFFTETKRAFGRIAQALQKFSQKFEIDIFDWAKKGKSYFGEYDLIYATLWDGARSLERQFPEFSKKIVFSAHGLAEFVKTKFDQNVKHEITAEELDRFQLEEDLMTWLRSRIAPLSVVSHELATKMQLFLPQPAMITQCGVDTSQFYPAVKDKQKEQKPLRVLFSYPKEGETCGYGYDGKRKKLVFQIADFFEKNPDYGVEIVVPKTALSMEQMTEFYQSGDVFLCVSHSEGNPLGSYEAGACGLTVVSTRVGEMPHFISDGENGFLIDNTSEEQVKTDVVDRLIRLSKDKELLETMKTKMMRVVNEEWTWERKVEQWDSFFSQSLDNINKN